MIIFICHIKIYMTTLCHVIVISLNDKLTVRDQQTFLSYSDILEQINHTPSRYHHQESTGIVTFPLEYKTSDCNCCMVPRAILYQGFVCLFRPFYAEGNIFNIHFTLFQAYIFINIIVTLKLSCF